MNIIVSLLEEPLFLLSRALIELVIWFSDAMSAPLLEPELELLPAVEGGEVDGGMGIDMAPVTVSRAVRSIVPSCGFIVLLGEVHQSITRASCNVPQVVTTSRDDRILG